VETRTQSEEHKLRLEADLTDRDQVRDRLIDYMERTGLTEADFASRIGYSHKTLRMFCSDRWYHVAGTAERICRAISEFIANHPIMPPTEAFGELYETSNVRTMRQTFQQLLPRPVAYMIYAPPGSQKSFVLEYLVAEFNRQQLKEKGALRECAFYLYAMVKMTPSQLLKAVAVACGTSSAGDRPRIIRNLSHQFCGRRVLLVVDEAQHLSIPCFEQLRHLLDQPPHFSILCSGSHDLKQSFNLLEASLEQWNSRFIDKVRLPGVKEDEAEGIILREIGELLKASSPEGARKTIRALIAGSTVKDGFEKGRRYINVRTLTNALEQIKLQAEAAKDE
jgi:hypothetical protein